MTQEEKNEPQIEENAAEQSSAADNNTQKKKLTFNERAEFTTPMNDPDLLVGPYKPVEGQPKTITCPNCGEEMPTTIDTCVSCGHYLKREDNRYKPMDQAKVKKIRWIVGTICVVAFIIYMILRNV